MGTKGESQKFRLMFTFLPSQLAGTAADFDFIDLAGPSKDCCTPDLVALNESRGGSAAPAGDHFAALRDDGITGRTRLRRLVGIQPTQRRSRPK